MDKVVIFGTEQFAEQLMDFFEADERSIAGFCTDKAYLPQNRKLRGLPVVAYEELEDHFPPAEYGILFAMGYTKMNMVRKERMDDAIRRGYTIESYTHPSAIINAEKMGYGNIIMEGVILGQGVSVGDGNIFWPAAHVAHHTSVGNYNFFTISVAVAGNVKIGDFCVFGANCTVKNSISIEDGTLVGAGSYIAHSTEAWSVYAPPRTYKLEGKTSLDFKL